MKSLFLTGGSGFIGRAFLNDYARDYSQIFIPIRRPVDFSLPKNVTSIIVSGTSESVTQAFKSQPCDIVINMAAYGVMPGHRKAIDMVKTNVEMPVGLMKAAAQLGCSGFLQLGSMSEYAPTDRALPTQETDLTVSQGDTYGATKAMATQHLGKLADQLDVNTMVLRLFGVFGPGEAAHRLLPSLRKNLLAGVRVPMSEGSQLRDFVYIADVTRAIDSAVKHLCAERGVNEVVNIGTGLATSVADFSYQFCRAIGANPNLLGFGDLPMRDSDIAYMCADITHAKALLNWSPQWSIARALESYLRNEVA